MMDKRYFFNNSVIYGSNKPLSFTESVNHCKELGAKLLSKESLMKNMVYNKIKKLEYMIASSNNSTDCFSLFDFTFPKESLENSIVVCKEDYEFDNKYLTLCEQTITERISENNNRIIVLIVLVITFLLLGILAPVLFFCRKKIFARFHHPLVEDDADRNSNQVST